MFPSFKSFVVLKEFIKAHDRLPMAVETLNGVNVGNWLTHQKHDYGQGKLTSDHEMSLRAVGVDFDRSLKDDLEGQWPNNYELLKAFSEAYGRTPANREAYKGENIGLWLYNQKQAFKKGKLSPERAQLLRVMGVKFK
jgi:hypothetical protein